MRSGQRAVGKEEPDDDAREKPERIGLMIAGRCRAGNHRKHKHVHARLDDRLDKRPQDAQLRAGIFALEIVLREGKRQRDLLF